MKNMMKYWMFVAVAAMGMISCSEDKSESNIPAPELPMVTMTVMAEDAEADDSRTYYDEDAGKARWESTGEKICVWESIDAAAATKAESAEAVVTDGKAAFTVEFTEATGTEFAYNAVYPSSAVVNLATEDDNLDVTKLKLNTPAVQTSTATSFDGAADLLIAQPKSFEAQPTELSLAFKRVVAVGKMTLKNIATEDAILSVTFSSTDKVLAGRSYFDATTGEVVEYGYYSASDLLTINFEGGLTNVKEGTPIFFTALPCAIAGGESFTVTVSTASQKFTRTVTLPEANSIAFNAGRISSFSVNMASADVSEITSLEGEYAVMALNDGYLQLMGDQENSYLKKYQKDAATEIPTSYDTTDESLIWIVESADTEGQYYLKQKSSGKYVAWTSGNTAVLQEAAYALTIAKQDDGSYNVTSVKDNTRNLRYNASSPRFAFYASAQTPIYLVPVKVSTDPKLQVNAQPETVAAEGADVEVALTTANLTDEIEAEVAYTDGEGWISSVAVADNKLTFTVAENTTEEERTATITLSANGVEDTVTVKQSGKVAEGAPQWVRVTSLDDITEGTYVIVAQHTSSNVDYYCPNSTLYNDTTHPAAVTLASKGVTVSGDLLVGDVVDDMKWVFSGSNTAMTITKFGDTKKLYATNTNNGVWVATPSTSGSWGFTVKNSNFLATYSTSDPRCLGLYNTQDWRSYKATALGNYSNSGGEIRLYKLMAEGTGGDETPEQKQDQTLSFSESAATATIGEDFTEPTLSGAMTTVAYTSSNTEVATVDAETGAVTLLAAGQTTITATAAESDAYNAATASYTLTVEAAQGGGETASWHEESWSNFSGTETYVSGSVEGDLGTWSYVGCSAYEQNTTKLTGYISMSNTSKSAKITSPTFENGIGGIKFNYYVNNTARKFKVTVYENGVAVKTETIIPTAKTTVLSYEITVTTTGSTYFVFEPTTTSNRVSIGKVQVYY